MKLRSKSVYSPKDAGVRWTALPAEIRLMILKELKGGSERQNLSGRASVSREWQAFFEPPNFENLKLQFPGSDIDDLDSIARGYRRHLVKRISLHVNIEEYETKITDDFDRPETRETIKANNKIFSQALKKLFCSLSTWVDESPTGGLKLRLSASSPSDLDHPWKHRHRPTRHDSLRIRSTNSRHRLLGSLLDFSSGNLKLSQVSVVRHFSVNQYCYRSLSRASLAKVLASLCHLRTINYEPWHSVGQRGQFSRDEALILLLDFVGKSTTTKYLHLWEAQSSLHGNSHSLRPVNDDLVSSAVDASYNLRGFTLCHAVDAKDYFLHTSRGASSNTPEALNDFRVWPVLRRLALTTDIRDLTSSPFHLERLLLQASQAALRMPVLELMEIWAPGIGEGFVFRYDARKDPAVLTVVASWHLALGKETIKSWKLVASHSRLGQYELTYETRLVKPEATPLDSPYALCFKMRQGNVLREWKCFE